MLANREKIQLGGPDNEAESGLSRMRRSSHFRLSLLILMAEVVTDVPDKGVSRVDFPTRGWLVSPPWVVTNFFSDLWEKHG